MGEVEKNLGEVQQSSSQPPWKVRAYKKNGFNFRIFPSLKLTNKFNTLRSCIR